MMGKGKEDEELIKIAVRDKIKNIHEVGLNLLTAVNPLFFTQDLNVGEDRQISLRLFSEYCAAKMSEHDQ